jgi:pyruvate dehydrogenase E2 component (dihydrolipoamide acetyltransferase)
MLSEEETAMASEIKLPELGENVEEGEVVDVRAAAGEDVRAGQTLLEIEAEKTTVEVPSPLSGRITEMLVKRGDRVRTGQRLCVIEAGDGQQTSGKKERVLAGTPKTKEGPVASSSGPSAAAGPALSPPTAAPGAAPAATAPLAPPVTPARGNGRQAAFPAAGAEKPQEQLVPAGPATRRLARELGVNLTQVHGSAPAGRVTQDDVKAYVRHLAAGGAAAGGAAAGGMRVPALPNFEQWGPVERKPLDAVRRKTAEQMALAWSQVPHVTQHDVADITELDAFRHRQEGKGPKLTVTVFTLKAVAIALRQFPQFNSSLDTAGSQLVLKHYYHIGIAVDTERGLLVPVIRDVDKKSIHDLAEEMADLAERARQKKLTADQMRGGTFTISNLGGIGGTAFTPIVHFPEVAILGMSRAQLQPVARDGQFVPRLLLPLSLSYDHRVIDGADAARFTRRLAELLENPLVMLVHA